MGAANPLLTAAWGAKRTVGLFPHARSNRSCHPSMLKQVHGRVVVSAGGQGSPGAELRAHWTRLETGVVSPHRPDDARQLVGQGDGGAVVAPQALQPQRPSSQAVRMLAASGGEQRRAGTVDQQGPQVRV